MTARKGLLAIAAIAALVLVALPSAAWAWTESGAGSSVDASFSAKDCEFCHGGVNGTSWYPYLRPYGIHGGYTTTSNQCASCHNVHVAAGDKLLMKATATATCLACHDGTGAFGVYGTIKARTGSDPAGGHSAITDRTNVVPGGDDGTGGSRTETEYRGESGLLGCVDCHSPHGSQLVAAFDTERQRYDRGPFGLSESTNLLKQKPNGSLTTTAVYGSAWCSGCHRGRHSDGSVVNHPVDSTTFSYDSVPLAAWGGVVDISCNGINGIVFVADPGNRLIKKFTAAGGHLGNYASWGGTPFMDPRGVTVAAGNLLWTGDPRQGWLALFNQNLGAFGASYPHLRAGAREYVSATSSLTAAGVGTNPAGTRIVVTDTEANVVQVRDSDTIAGNLIWLRPVGGLAPNPYPGSALGEFNAPTDGTIGPSGVIYVVDSMNNRVQRFAANGEVIDSFGTYGTGAGQFDRPLSISTDAAGMVYVADSGNHRIQRFTAAGAYVSSFGTVGTDPGEFRLPAGVSVNDFNGDIYVVDVGNSRIQRLTPAGVFVAEWGTPGSGNSQFKFQPTETGSMAYAYDIPNANAGLAFRQMYKGLVYAGRGYVMQDPRTAAQDGHGPICQQCHEDARNAGALYDGLAVPAITATVKDGAENTAGWGERDRANPRFANFPHETTNSDLLVETGDNLCTNCHSLTNLP